MHITNYSDYALRTLMYLASVPDQSALSNITDISNSYRISRSHLTKIIHQLSKEGFIESIRGKNGGIRLAKEPKFINLGDVLRRTEPSFATVPCLKSAQYDSLEPNTSEIESLNSTSVDTKHSADGFNSNLDSNLDSHLDSKDNSKELCTIIPICHLKSIIYDATQAFLNVMDSYTLEDIVKNRDELWKTLNFKQAFKSL